MTQENVAMKHFRTHIYVVILLATISHAASI
jgi:hypothetical protein